MPPTAYRGAHALLSYEHLLALDSLPLLLVLLQPSFWLPLQLIAVQLCWLRPFFLAFGLDCFLVNKLQANKIINYIKKLII